MQFTPKPKLAITCVALLFCSVVKAQDNPQHSSSSEMMYQNLKMGTVIKEGPEDLPLPSSRQKMVLKPNSGTLRKVAPPTIYTIIKTTGDSKIAVDNLNIFGVSKIPVIVPNPSATAEYCTTPTAYMGCCGYWIKNNISNTNELYAGSTSIFADETSARNYYLQLHPAMPFYLPYAGNSKAHAVGGWLYGNGNGHGSVDFSKSGDAYGAGIDPTFNVLAAQSGKVVATDWVDLFGNYIIIEHAAPNGANYRTGYFHLRNGFDHDLDKAKHVAVTSGDPRERDSLYKKYAFKPNPNQLVWGNNNQKIKVKVGDMVTAGQQIAFAGNTGYGGAGWGLNPDDNANPYDNNTVNNHLHFMLWQPSPANTNSVSWLEVDPYGVYAKLNADDASCYEPGYNKAFHRFFAPFYPSFHNVPVAYIINHWDYYTTMGMALQTLSIYRSGNEYLASGSFQYGIPGDWYCRINMNSQQYQQYFDQYKAKGYVPRQISVTKDNGGSPLFAVIWRKLDAGENIVAYHNLDDAGFDNAWKKNVDQDKNRCAEHVRYNANGKSMHAAVFTNKKEGFYVYQALSLADFSKKFAELDKANYMPSNISVEELQGGTTFGGTWVPKGNKTYHAYAEMTPQDYQNKFSQFSQQGFRLYRIAGYSNAGKFTAIWVK